MAQRPRARALDIPFHGQPGPLNAITDVPGVEVGHCTLVEGTTVRTGVTAIWPRGRESSDPTFGGWFSLNGNGEMTGTAWIDESGFVDGPVLLTNTHSVGTVRDAFIRWMVKNGRRPGTNLRPDGDFWALPIVAETYDGYLNDINRFAIGDDQVAAALESARAGPVEEGNAGAGTGMICYQFKAGIGTASRLVPEASSSTLGVLVQANCGRRHQLLISGVPVGREIPDDLPANDGPSGESGSIIVVVATDAPLLPHQAKRLAKRAAMGLARTGSSAGNGSGDLFLAFSTANGGIGAQASPATVSMLPNESLTPLFEAAVQATEEAIVNSLTAAETTIGFRGRRAPALPLDRLVQVMRRYGRL